MLAECAADDDAGLRPPDVKPPDQKDCVIVEAHLASLFQSHRDKLDQAVGDIDRKLDLLTQQVSKCLEGIGGIQTTAAARDHMSRGASYSWNLPAESPRSAVSIPSPIRLGRGELELLASTRGSQEQQSNRLAGFMTHMENLGSLDEEVQLDKTGSPTLTKMRTGASALSGLAMTATASLSEFHRQRQRSSLAKRTWKFIEEPDSSRPARIFSVIWPTVIGFLAILSVALSVEMVPPITDKTVFVDVFVDILNTAEFLVRFWSCPNRFGFLRSPFSFFDFCAALPLAIRAAVGHKSPVEAEEQGDWITWCYFVCVVSMFRLMKMIRQFEQIHVFLEVFRNVLEPMRFLLFVQSMMVLLFASLVYIVEPRSNVETFGMSVWFVTVTMSTVGYGDISPVTFPGYVLTSCLIFSSVFFMALPVGILGNAFTQVWKDRDLILLKTRTKSQLVMGGFQPKDIPDVFSIYDSNKDGELNVDEFSAMMKGMGLRLAHERVVDLFETIDKDGGGTICDKEFVRLIFPTSFHEIYGRRKKAARLRKSRSFRQMASSEFDSIKKLPGLLRNRIAKGSGEDSPKSDTSCAERSVPSPSGR